MAKYDELRNFDVVKQWFNRIRKSPKTEKNYLMGLQKYVDYTGLNPEELITEAEDEVDRNVKLRNRAVLTRREGFITYLESKGTSSSVILNAMNAVNSFYKSQFIKDFPVLVTKITPQPKEENIIFIEKQDIVDLLTIADPLEKAVILTGATSGLSMIDICHLRVKTFKDGFDPETGITTIPWTRMKSLSRIPVKFITFLTPEASEAVLAYLKFRNRESAPHQHVTSDDGYLFIKERIVGKYIKKKDKTSKAKVAKYDPKAPNAEETRKMTEASVTRMFARLAERSGKINPVGWNVVRSHQMRKFFFSTLMKPDTGNDFFFVDRLIGHKPTGSNNAYFHCDATSMKAEYIKKCVPYLTFGKSGNVIDDENYKRMKAENEMYRARNASVEVERYEIEKIKSEQEKTKEVVKKIVKGEELTPDNVEFWW